MKGVNDRAGVSWDGSFEDVRCWQLRVAIVSKLVDI